MPISKSAVTKFLNRELDSFNWLKEAPEDLINEAINNLDPVPKFTRDPYINQKVMVLLGASMPHFLFFNDMGTGKTAGVANILAYRKLRDGPCPTLVLVPNVPSIQTWVDEVPRAAPDLTVVPLFGTTVEKWETIWGNPNGDLYVVNYDSLLHMVSDLDRGALNDKGKVIGLVKDNEKIAYLAKCIGMRGLVLDESHRLITVQSKAYLICRRLSLKHASIRYAMTGTPFGRLTQHLWPQFYVIDHGVTLGPTLGLFKEAFCYKVRNHWTGFDEYKPDPHKEALLHNVLQNRSIRYMIEECIDLPPKIYTTVKLRMPTGTLGYYAKVIASIRASRETGMSPVKVVEHAFIRMRQIASGYMTVKGDDVQIRKQDIQFPENPRLDTLMSLLDGIPNDRKVIVFHEFIPSGQYIAKRLRKAKIEHTTLWGATKNKVGSIQKFQKDKKCRVLVANSRSGNSALDLPMANYIIFYETPVSPVVRQQCERRIARPGQRHKMFYYDLVMRNTEDERIQMYLAEGKDLMSALLDGTEELS